MRYRLIVPEELFDKFTRELAEWNVDQENRVGWVCIHCSESTYETDFDYLTSPNLHLSCALELDKQ